MFRPWHDAPAIARTLAITRANEKGGLGGRWKARPNISCMGWYCPPKILNSLSRIYFNWYNRINFKLILLTLLFKSLFFKKNLNCSFFCYLIYFQSLRIGASVNMFYLDTFSAVTLFLSLFSKRMATSTSLLPCVVTPDSFQTWPFTAKHQNSTFFLLLSNIINLFDISFLVKSIFSYH